ncbi:PorT family protein [Gillisia sp. M10.2A]|uniref:PorT family protein n=1 Tax=Gillisia lutea TaxID=2909668 RepID=A0ABS9EI24_9FLAO|nr:PorT family protein [Gillisia lutea]MCF4102500.1 PorT family protein [Gillisia lutea]
MKKLLVIAIVFISGTAMAQSSFGIKGGLNYGATGDYENYSQVADDVTTIENGKEKTGYHLGVFGKFEVVGIFIQPELVYTRLNTEYNTFDYKIDKIDAPLLVGLNVLGPLNIKAGPSFQYILNNDFENSALKVSKVDNEITLGYQLGAGLNLGRLGLDLRYEGAFKENNAFGEMASDNNFKIDSRPSQWILSLSYNLK